MGRVNVVDPSNGRVISVDRDTVPDLEALGYHVESPDERVQKLQREAEADHYSSTGQTVLAGVEGLGRGATLGLSDLFEGDEAAKRAAYHPWVSTGADLVGSLIPGLLTGGVSEGATGAELGAEAPGLVSQIAGATPTGLLGAAAEKVGARFGTGVMSKVVRGAVEGAGFGAGGELSRASLSGDPVTAEGVLAGAGWGVAFGAGAGALSSGLEGVAGGARRRIAARLEDEVSASLRGTPLDIPEAYTKPVALEEAQPTQPFPGARSAIDAREAASAGVLPAAEYRQFRAATKSVQDAADQAVDVADIQHRDARAAADNFAEGTPGEQVARIGTQGSRVYAEAIGGGGKITPEIKSAGRRLQAAWRWLNKAVDDDKPGLFPERLEKYKNAVTDLARLTNQSVKLSPDVAATARAFQEVAKLHQAVSTMAEHLPPDADSWFAMGRNRAEKVFAAAGEILSSSVPAAAPVKRALADSIKALTETAGVKSDGGPLESLRALWASGHAARDSAADQFLEGAWGKPRVVVTPGKTAPVGGGEGPVGPASRYEPKPAPVRAKKGVTAADQIQKFLLKRAGYGAAGAVFGHEFGHPIAWAVTGALLAGKGRALDLIDRAAARLADPAARAVAAAGPVAEPLARTLHGQLESGKRADLFASRSAEIRQLSATAKDQAFASSLQMTAAGHPELAKGVYDTAVNAAEVLAARLPKSPPGTNWGTEYLWKVPPEQMTVFSQEYHAVSDPAGFLGHAASAPEDVFPSAVQALQAAWPALYSRFRAGALAQIAAKGTGDMGHGRLVALSVLLDAKLAPTMTPEFISAQAGMFGEPPPQPPKPGPSGQSGRPGASDMTAAQRTESR